LPLALAMLGPASFAKSRQDQFKACRHTLIKARKLGLMRVIELGPVVNVVVDGDMWGRLPDAAKIHFARTVSCWALQGMTGKQIRMRVYDYRTHPMPDSTVWATLQ
jgi:hypothetical protein